MSQTTSVSLPDAARQMGVGVRVLRRAIRAGKLPAPPALNATVALPAEWLASAKARVAEASGDFGWGAPQKVPAFARYEGTSAWRKYSNRVREYNHFRATTAASA